MEEKKWNSKKNHMKFQIGSEEKKWNLEIFPLLLIGPVSNLFTN